MANDLIAGGDVWVDGRVVRKAAWPVPPTARVEVRSSQPGWVSRGAVKLAHALHVWGPEGLAVVGRRCLDVGASTGGFTQVLVRHGACHVTALDVGQGQLAAVLREDPRVTDLSRTHLRNARPETIGGRVDLLVADLSFIGLSSVLPSLVGLCHEGADLVLLVKPQFEVGPARVGRGGVVHDRAARSLAVRQVIDAGYAAGLAVRGLISSPITGVGGNREYLVWAAPRRPGMMGPQAAASLGAGLIQRED